MSSYETLGCQHNKSRRSLFLVLTTYLLIFGPKFYIVDVSVSVAIGLAIFYLIKTVVNGRISKNVLHPWICISIIVVYFSIISVATNNDPSLLAMEFGKLNIYIASAAGLVELYRNYYGEKYSVSMLQDIYISILVTAMLVIVLFLLPEFRYLAYSLVDIYMFHGRPPEAITNRITDLSIGGSTVSLIFVFGAVLSMDRNIWQSGKALEYLSLFFFIIMAVAALLTGRTGFVLLIAIVAVWLISNSIKRPLSVLNYVGSLAIAAFLIAILAVFFVNNQALDQFVDNIAPWAFELIYSYNETGEFDSASGRYIADQYTLPDTSYGVLFGGGKYDIPSDSLFVKLIHSVGMVGLIMTLLMFVILLHQTKVKIFEKYLYLYLGLLIVGNFKETMLGNARGAIILFLLLIIAAKQLKKHVATHAHKKVGLTIGRSSVRS